MQRGCRWGYGGDIDSKKIQEVWRKTCGVEVSKISKQLAAGCWSAFGKVDLCCDLGGQWAVRWSFASTKQPVACEHTETNHSFIEGRTIMIIMYCPNFANLFLGGLWPIFTLF